MSLTLLMIPTGLEPCISGLKGRVSKELKFLYL